MFPHAAAGARGGRLRAAQLYLQLRPCQVRGVPPGRGPVANELVDKVNITTAPIHPNPPKTLTLLPQFLRSIKSTLEYSNLIKGPSAFLFTLVLRHLDVHFFLQLFLTI